MAKLKDTEVNGNLNVSEDVQIGNISVLDSLNDIKSRIGTNFCIINASDFKNSYGNSSLPSDWGHVFIIGNSRPNQSSSDTYYLCLGDTGMYHGVQLNGATQVTWYKAT